MRSRGISASDYERAFAKLLPTMHERKKHFLRIMMGLPNQTASSRFLLSRLDVQHDIIVNQTIGQLGKQVFRIIGVHPDGWKKPFQTWTVIAETGEAIDAGYPWKLRRQVVEALRALGFNEEIDLGEEVIPQLLLEGSPTKRLVNVYERSPEARDACLEEHGFRCAICDFDFEESYGNLMKGFIHVHHLRPLAEIRKQYVIDPASELVPVCPNCHAVIHYGKTTRSILEVRKMMMKKSKQPTNTKAVAPRPLASSAKGATSYQPRAKP